MKNNFSILFFFYLITYSGFGQDTLYYDNNWKETNSLKKSTYYKINLPDENDKNLIIEKTYFKSGQIQSNISYLVHSKYSDKRTGKSSVWSENGELRFVFNHKDGKQDGPFLSYWSNGKLKRKDNYKKGKFKSGECWNENGKKVKYYDFEISSKYPGGQEKMRRFIIENSKYPVTSKINNSGGKVMVAFQINLDGTLDNIRIVRGVNSKLNQEAIRIMKIMPKWEPRYQNGIPLEERRSITIVFKSIN